MNPISNVHVPMVLPGQSPVAADPAKGTGSFKNFLLESIHEVNSMQQDADRAVEKLVTGGEVNPAEVLTAVQKADLAFRLMLQVRNKMVQAYEEVKNIRV
ncbi:MAG: flagellar hook-basal body complex protein FliE [Planctomycetota bacterium]|jgi:flagellar hook-basal body complex protein FliE